ncbi:MAG: TlpA family protein disulfide reductase [Muribaculaceae bacterium]|nr:TlpA family protein disulfide reductase [Muribaculaceae bacterium]
MKKQLMAMVGVTLLAGCAWGGEIKVTVAPEIAQSAYDIEYMYVSDLVKPRMHRPEAKRETINAENGKFTIKTAPGEMARYIIPVSDQEYILIYAEGDDQVDVNITDLNPAKYTMTGTPLVEGISYMESQTSKLMSDFQKLKDNGEVTEEAVKKAQSDYNKIYTDYAETHPDSPAVPYALMQMEGQDFTTTYNSLSEQAKKSPLMPMIESQKKYVERKLTAEKRMAELQSGTLDAPDFTFRDIEGKNVSLSDFKGKWVIIDFWGTWCPWCIKGFPELKEAYKEYSGKLEILGVACNDPYDKWVAGVKKYDLPWVNVYNPEEGGGQVLEDYAVEGFPTKVIVSPEGKVVNVTSGHVPEFFEKLKELIK